MPRRSSSAIAPQRAQQGQAMIEIVVALLLVLIPLFVFAWALNSYGTTRNLTLSAARYAAWERTVWFETPPGDSPLTGNFRVQKSQTAIQQEMHQRVFLRQTEAGLRSAAPTDPLRNNAAVTYTAGHDGRNRLELERANGSNEQGSRPSLRLVHMGTTTSTGVASALSSFSAITSSLSGSPRIDLQSRGIWQAQVQLRPNALDISAVSSDLSRNAPQRYLPFVTFNETAAVMSDPWNAGGYRHEEARVKPLVPANIFSNSVFDAIRSIVGFVVEPLRPSNLKPGYVDTDQLPTDRQRR